jgi:hypothetical protein
MDRLLRISSGYLLYASDIQGHEADFDRVLQRFSLLKEKHQATKLILGGDLLHGYPGYEDRSFSLLQRVMELGDPQIILLMGNHELSHVLHWRLRKGGLSFVENLEAKFGPHRRKYAQFLCSLPFGVLTAGGILLNHTGPSGALSPEPSQGQDEVLWNWFWNLDFRSSLPPGPVPLDAFEPEYGASLLNSKRGETLWEAFMNKNEFQIEDYEKVLKRYLRRFDPPCRYLISGHIPAPEGFQVISDRQLRVCTSYGAKDQNSKKLLLVDAARTYANMGEILGGLQPLF